MKKTIIISGAAGNLGKSVTGFLLEKGYHIEALLGPTDDSAFINHENLNSESVNLTNSDDSKNFIKKTIANEEREVIALICLVGVFNTGDIRTTSFDDIQKMISLNFGTAYNLIQPLATQFNKQEKELQIILIGSKPALIDEDGKKVLAYALSKSLIFKLSDFINADKASSIKASVIVPSTIDTPATRHAMPDSDPSKWVPLENINETILFILSDTGKMMNNQTYKLYNKA